MKKWIVICLFAYLLTIDQTTGKLIGGTDTSKVVEDVKPTTIEVEVDEVTYNKAMDAKNEQGNPYNQDTEFNNDGTIKKQYNSDGTVKSLSMPSL